MSDEDLIGYLFDLLDPEVRAAVAARVAEDPAAAARLDGLRLAVGPLVAVAEAEREAPPEPPPGLALRTIAAVAGHVVEHEPRAPDPAASESVLATFLREFTAEPPELEFDSGTRAKRPDGPPLEPHRAPPPSDGPDYRAAGRLRADMIVAACIALVGISLVLSGLAKARHEARVAECQNNLRLLHTGLAGYADNFQGNYPRVGPPAADFTPPMTDLRALADLGYLPPSYKPVCPAAPEAPAYTYTLGFRGPNGELLGYSRPASFDTAAEADLMPISADHPSAAAAPTGSPVSPHGRTMNVLYVGGNVRITTSANVGPGGDDIYRNVHGQVAPGVHRADAVLGRADTRP